MGGALSKVDRGWVSPCCLGDALGDAQAPVWGPSAPGALFPSWAWSQPPELSGACPVSLSVSRSRQHTCAQPPGFEPATPPLAERPWESWLVRLSLSLILTVRAIMSIRGT